MDKGAIVIILVVIIASGTGGAILLHNTNDAEQYSTTPAPETVPEPNTPTLESNITNLPHPKKTVLGSPMFIGTQQDGKYYYNCYLVGYVEDTILWSDTEPVKYTVPMAVQRTALTATTLGSSVSQSISITNGTIEGTISSPGDNIKDSVSAFGNMTSALGSILAIVPGGQVPGTIIAGVGGIVDFIAQAADVDQITHQDVNLTTVTNTITQSRMETKIGGTSIIKFLDERSGAIIGEYYIYCAVGNVEVFQIEKFDYNFNRVSSSIVVDNVLKYHDWHKCEPSITKESFEIQNISSDQIQSDFNSMISALKKQANGSLEKPYILSTAEDFLSIKMSDRDKNYLVYKDVPSIILERPIGRYILSTHQDYIDAGFTSYEANILSTIVGAQEFDLGFKGNIDGKGHSIAYTLDNISGAKNPGLFSSLSGEVKNLHVTGTIKLKNNDVDNSYVGIIAGLLHDGEIRNCSTSGSIEKSRTEEGPVQIDAGGIAGRVSGTSIVVGCVSNVSIAVTAKDNVNAGGIAGTLYGNSTLSYSASYGNVTGYVNNSNGGHHSDVGGIVGYAADDTRINNCCSLMNKIQADANINFFDPTQRDAGGIAGHIKGNVNIKDCYYLKGKLYEGGSEGDKVVDGKEGNASYSGIKLFATVQLVIDDLKGNGDWEKYLDIKMDTIETKKT